MPPFARFLLLASPLLPVAWVALRWLAVECWPPSTEENPYPSLPLARFFGGNPSEVYTHWLNVWGCSGVFAGAAWLLVAERLVRPRVAPAWRGSWALGAGAVYALANWSALWWLDAWKGEGPLPAVVAMVIAPLFALTIPPFLLFAASWRSTPAYVATAFAMVAAVAGAQFFFEPSESGGPNPLFVGALFVAADFAGIAVFTRLLLTRAALRKQGYTWARLRDAAFVALNLGAAGRIPPRDEMAPLPGYADGDIKSVARLAMLREEPTGP